MSTNFEKVIDFHKQFGLTYTTLPQPDVFDNDPKLIKLRMDLIREEVRELEDAVKNKDYVEAADALGDILYVVYGAGASLGMDMNHIFELIHQSNMSKLCKTEDEAVKTVEWYKQQYLEGTQPYDSPAFRISENGLYWVVYNSSNGKILKSINYNPVDLTCILPQTDETDETN